MRSDDLVELVEGAAAINDIADHFKISERHNLFFYHKDTKEGTKDTKLKDQPFDAIFQQSNIKINEKPKAVAGKFEIGENLCGMDLSKRVDGFYFDDQFVFYQDIDTVTGIQFYGLINQGKGFFLFSKKAGF